MPTASTAARDRLIVALDVPSRDAALELVRDLGDAVAFYKVGLQLFLAAGMDLVRELAARGKRVFLDLKMDDVDETIRLAVAEAARVPGIELLTLLGGPATARAAVAGRGAAERPRLLQVTVLSSQGQGDLEEAGLVGPKARFPALEDYAVWRARRAMEAGCDGVVASGQSVARLRAELAGNRFVIVCPGIRPAGSGSHEHKRSNTPAGAIRAGADYLVVGRPIRDAADRRGAALAILEEMGAELESSRALR